MTQCTTRVYSTSTMNLTRTRFITLTISSFSSSTNIRSRKHQCRYLTLYHRKSFMRITRTSSFLRVSRLKTVCLRWSQTVWAATGLATTSKISRRSSSSSLRLTSRLKGLKKRQVTSKLKVQPMATRVWSSCSSILKIASSTWSQSLNRTSLFAKLLRLTPTTTYLL